MRLFLALDFETTSKIPTEARITEVGAALYDPERRAVLLTFNSLCRLPAGVPFLEEAQQVSGIVPGDLESFGRPLPDVLLDLGRLVAEHHVERFVGHKGRAYDLIVLQNEISRLAVCPGEIRALLAVPWVDTLADIAYPDRIACRKLPCLAAAHGFLNPFPHRALPDAMTCLKLMEYYPIEEVLRRADSPAIVLHSRHAFGDNDKAKQLGFRWKPELGKRWLRAAKEIDLQEIREKAAAFPELQIQRVNDVTAEQVAA